VSDSFDEYYAHEALFTVAVVLFLLSKAAYTQTKRTGCASERRVMSLTVKWGKERYGNPTFLIFCSDILLYARLHLTLPSPDPKLGEIRQTLAEYSHLPTQNIKLIFGGGIMKDDNFPSEYV
jgi:hypothetical protein